MAASSWLQASGLVRHLQSIAPIFSSGTLNNEIVPARTCSLPNAMIDDKVQLAAEDRRRGCGCSAGQHRPLHVESQSIIDRSAVRNLTDQINLTSVYSMIILYDMLNISTKRILISCAVHIILKILHVLLFFLFADDIMYSLINLYTILDP